MGSNPTRVTMELRYIKNGEEYMPQILSKKTGEWKNIQEELLKDTVVGKFAQAIADIDDSKYMSGMFGGYTVHAQLFYDNTKELYFKTEMKVMSFLGALKGYLAKDTKEFTL